MIKEDFNLDLEKYKNLILYLANIIPITDNGKKKMFKLLFYIDFYHYQKYGNSITGDKYVKLPLGPAPKKFELVVDKLQKEKKLSISEQLIGRGYKPRTLFNPTVKSDLSIFTEEEKNTINNVLKKFGKIDGNSLSILTHSEIAYKKTDSKKEIDYDLSFLLNLDIEKEEDEDEFLNVLIEKGILKKVIDNLRKKYAKNNKTKDIDK